MTKFRQITTKWISYAVVGAINNPHMPCNNDNPNIRLNKVINSVPKNFGKMTANNLVYMHMAMMGDVPLVLDRFDSLWDFVTEGNIDKRNLENENQKLRNQNNNLDDENRKLKDEIQELRNQNDYRDLLGDYHKLVKDGSKPMKDNLKYNVQVVING